MHRPLGRNINNIPHRLSSNYEHSLTSPNLSTTYSALSPSKSTMDQPKVRVGVGVFVLQSKTQDPSKPSNPSFLIGRRKGSHGSGKLQLPGGHLEFGESFEDCATREVLEETGLQVTAPRLLTCTNDHMASEGKHYVTVFMVCARADETQEARVMEPEKCEGWEWCEWTELVEVLEEDEERLFLPLVNLLRTRPSSIPGLSSS